MKTVILIIIAYLIGSIPFSYLSSIIKGKDPRQGGTGNVGATNVLVVAGPLAGVLALVGDILKGYLVVMLARYFNLSDWGVVFCALSAVVGHDFSLFLGFSGGKGIATFGGALIAMDPLFALLVVLLWILAMVITRYFIPSTILILFLIPFLMWLGSWRIEYIFYALGALGLGLYTHRRDIKRFLDKKELTIQESMAKHLKK